MKNNMWAVSLEMDSEEELEKRISHIVEYLRLRYPHANWLIRDLDATGLLGNTLTVKRNNSGLIRLTHSEFLDLLNENGQIFELNALAVSADDENYLKVIVRDGVYIDILGWIEKLPPEVIKASTPLDVELYKPQ